MPGERGCASCRWDAARRRVALRHIGARFLAASIVAASLVVPATAADTQGESDSDRVDVAALEALAPLRAYRLRRAWWDFLVEAAEALAASRGLNPGDSLVISGATEPERPRLDIATEGAPRRGPQDAPITLVVVENPAQSYAARLDAALKAVELRWGEAVAIVHRDYVLPERRGNVHAVVAGRCAHAQGRFWDYRALQLADLYEQSPESLRRHAEALELDMDAFDACCSDPSVARQALEETTALGRIGIDLVPCVFVNGTYVGGTEGAEVLDAVVRQVQGPTVEVLPAAELPWRLAGVLMLGAGASQAVLVSQTGSGSRVVVVGDTLEPDVLVVEVEARSVILRNHGRLERLSMEAATPAAASPAEAADAAEPSDRALVGRNSRTIPLDAATRDRVATRRRRLAAQFSPGDLDVDGRKLLKLTGTDEARLLARLGLEPGDVVMRVNDAWTFFGEERLWDALVAGPPATVVVMRKGLPRLLEFAEPH
jgi:protein-disulfide isomerase/type II secretory pathway component PulC